MTDLRGKDYVVRVGVGSSMLQITGLDIHAEIEKGVRSPDKAEPNSCSLKIWNLSPDSRKAIEALSLKPRSSSSDGVQSGNIRVEIEAGYVTTGRTLLFRGDLRTAVSERSGPDIITTIEGEDGGRSVLRARVAKSFPPGTDLAAIVRECAAAMGVGAGNVADLTAQQRRTFRNGCALAGRAPRELARLLRPLGLTYSIQNGILQLQRAGQALSTKAVVLRPPRPGVGGADGTRGTGLVGSPQRDANGIVTATTLLIPEIIPGGRVLFDTKDLTGTYRIAKLKHELDSFGNAWYHHLECKA